MTSESDDISIQQVFESGVATFVALACLGLFAAGTPHLLDRARAVEWFELAARQKSDMHVYYAINGDWPLDVGPTQVNYNHRTECMAKSGKIRCDLKTTPQGESIAAMIWTPVVSPGAINWACVGPEGATGDANGALWFHVCGSGFPFQSSSMPKQER
jgi:hypothetical protein